MIKKVYIAASYPRRAEAQGVMALLELSGVAVTSWWLREETKEGYDQENMDHMAGAAARDIADVIEADTIICLTDGKVQLSMGGRHSEFGIALAMGKTCIIVGPREQVMHYHRDVIQYGAVSGLLQLASKFGTEIEDGSIEEGKLGSEFLFNEEAREFAGSQISAMYVHEIVLYGNGGPPLHSTIVWTKFGYESQARRDIAKHIIDGDFCFAVARCKTDNGTEMLITKDDCRAS